MQTRSAARKSAALAQAPSKTLTDDTTTEPIVIRWDHRCDNEENAEGGIPVETPRFNPITSDRSLDSLFYGSLSSITSSGGGSFSSVDNVPGSSSLASFTASQQAVGGLLSFVARNPAAPATPNKSAIGPTRVARGTPNRRLAKRPYPVAAALHSSSSADSMLVSPVRSMPLRRSNALSLDRDTEQMNNSAGPSGSSSTPKLKARTSSTHLDPNAIFQREMQTLLKSREQVFAGVKAVITDSKEKIREPPASPSKLGPSPTRRPLGPEGTEIIDESFRAAPGDPTFYPRIWVSHQSNILRAHPTQVDGFNDSMDVCDDVPTDTE